ncbi:acylphosphatase [Vibrio tapetis subsp. quintayensis]|uniref:acylphosphatase n=1 Tax=Vibrio tapetis TaxID=52443 RepID=UPI0025B3E6CE|nr:acylphosphatase [Vibrio tapetis]MDN3679081.1 acylphosphatase [Vibrio tapetis subsp. quintayensis]
MVQKCVRFSVNGQVQCVGFRFHTAQYALKLGLVGYAKNLNNGDVEVLACGEPMNVATLASWLEKGPKTARVDSVTSEEVSEANIEGFVIL